MNYKRKDDFFLEDWTLESPIGKKVLIYEDCNLINTEIGFLALDPNIVNEDLNGDAFSDLDEDCDLRGKSAEIYSTMLQFLNSTV